MALHPHVATSLLIQSQQQQQQSDPRKISSYCEDSELVDLKSL